MYRELLKEIDWRTKGAVTPVADQGQCGSCWAFSTVATLESAHFIRTGELLQLSQQQFVDCADGDYGNLGCSGGSPYAAYLYSDAEPIELASEYPYTGVEGTCMYQEGLGQVKANGFSLVMPNSPFEMQAAVMKGPISVSIEADSLYF